MTDAPSPGLLFPVDVACFCGWRGFERDRAGAYQLWWEHVEHSPLPHPHDPTNPTIIEGNHP